MPIYEYACRACGQTFEQLVPASPVAVGITCPGCASREVTRKLSVFGLKTSAGFVTPGGGGGGGGCGCGAGGCGCH